VIFVSRERYRRASGRFGRASGRFGGAVGNIGELERNLERLEQTMHLPWVYHVRLYFRLVAKLLPNCFLLLMRY
jgi:hypothetical protein